MTRVERKRIFPIVKVASFQKPQTQPPSSPPLFFQKKNEKEVIRDELGLAFTSNSPITTRTTDRKNNFVELATLAYGEAPYSEVEIASKHVLDVISKNEAGFTPITSRYPTFPTILTYALCGRFGYRVQQITVTNSSALDLTEEDARLIGRTIITIARKRKTGAVAIDAWRVQYKQLQVR